MTNDVHVVSPVIEARFVSLTNSVSNVEHPVTSNEDIMVALKSKNDRAGSDDTLLTEVIGFPPALTLVTVSVPVVAVIE